MWQHLTLGSSPYALTGLVDRPAGRAREMLTVQDRRDHLRAFGGPRGVLTIFHGASGSGRSALLRACAEETDRAQVLSVHLRASRQFDLREDIALYLEVALQTRRLRGPERMVYDRCREGDLAPLLQWVGLAARVGGRHGLALFIDDLDLVADFELEALLASAGEVEARGPVSPVMIVAAASHDVVERLDEIDAPPPLVQLHEIPVLDEVAVARALEEPAARHGVSWAGDAAWLVASATSGRPLLVQLLAHETWIHARPRRGETIGSADVRPALSIAASVLDDHFVHHLDELHTDELRYLDRLARATSHSRGALDAREVGLLEEMLSDTIPDPRLVRRRLERRGLVLVDAKGAMGFGGPTLGGLPEPETCRRAVRDRALARGVVDLTLL